MTIATAMHPRLAYGIEEAVLLSGVSRRQLYIDIANGKLRASFVAGRRRIMHEDLVRYLRGEDMPVEVAPRPRVHVINARA